MGVATFRDTQGRTRYRVTFSRDGRRLSDTRLPPGISKEQADEYHARLVSDWFNTARLGITKIPLIATVIREYEKRIAPGLRSPRYAQNSIAAAIPHITGKTLEQLPEAADSLAQSLQGAAPATIATRVGWLRSLGKYAVKWRLVKQDYGLGIQIPTFSNKRQFYIDKKTLAAIICQLYPMPAHKMHRMFLYVADPAAMR